MSTAYQMIQEANRKLGMLLEAMRNDSSGEAPLTTQNLAAVLAEVLRVGEWMGIRAVAESDRDLQLELDAYCQKLHQLREAMSRIHARLLTERARLETERAHLETATAWARGARTTS